MLEIAGNGRLQALDLEELRTVGADIIVRDNPLLQELFLSSLSGGNEPADSELLVRNNTVLQIVELPGLVSSWRNLVIGEGMPENNMGNPALRMVNLENLVQ